MKPTKKTAAKRTTAKRPAKRAVRSNSVEGKIMKLKNRIDDCYATPAPDGRVNANIDSNSDGDLGWCNTLLRNIREGNNVDRGTLKVANDLWSKYA